MSNTFTLRDCQIIRENVNAILVAREDEEDIWIPVSHIDHVVRSSNKFADQITMSRWIAEKKGLI